MLAKQDFNTKFQQNINFKTEDNEPAGKLTYKKNIFSFCILKVTKELDSLEVLLTLTFLTQGKSGERGLPGGKNGPREARCQ